MLEVLRIQNLAIVDELELEFGSGLNVLTGETGAGKSIILKAIELLSGARSSADIIRSGEQQCVVEGLFAVADETRESAAELSEEFAELLAGDELLIKRVVDRSGRSKVYLNGSLSTAALLQQLAACLFDITGQHQQQTLLDPANHLRMLDEYGVPPQLRQETAERFHAYAAVRRELEALQGDRRSRELHLEQIKAEHQELENAGLIAGEREDLEAELARLANFEALSADLTTCLALLEETEDSLDARLRAVLTRLDSAARLDPTLKAPLELAESSAAQLEEVRLSLSTYLSAMDADPQRLEYLRERIAEYARLQRKYRRTAEELIEHQQRLAREIAQLEGGGLDEGKLAQKLKQLEQELRQVEDKLTAARVEAGKRLSKSVEQGLASLSMKRAKFRVDIAAGNSSAHGRDRVEFALAANPGEPFQPLAKTASGGELSRILLVLKTILNERRRPDTQIFDEIDTGIGGAVAQVVGEKLREVAKRCQVLVVTHAPQIAALADSHFFIAKSATSKRTTTQVRLLDEAARIKHIASMLAGKEVTSRFEESARELLSLRK